MVVVADVGHEFAPCRDSNNQPLTSAASSWAWPTWTWSGNIKKKNGRSFVLLNIGYSLNIVSKKKQSKIKCSSIQVFFVNVVVWAQISHSLILRVCLWTLQSNSISADRLLQSNNISVDCWLFSQAKTFQSRHYCRRVHLQHVNCK